MPIYQTSRHHIPKDSKFHGYTYRNVKFHRHCYEERITREILWILPYQKRQGHGLAYKRVRTTDMHLNINRRNGLSMSGRWVPAIHTPKATRQHAFSKSVIQPKSRGQINIKGIPGGKVNNLGGHSIGHSKQKYLCKHVPYSERFPLTGHQDLQT